MPKMSKSVTIINVLKALKAIDSGTTKDVSYYRTRQLEDDGLVERSFVPRKRGRGRAKVQVELSSAGQNILDFAKTLE